jgi:Protein of unknown function (DUF4232)
MLYAKTVAAVSTVGLVGAGAVGVAQAAPTTKATTAATTPLCLSSQLVVSHERTEGAAGTFYDTWRLTNTGATCRTQGWVGLQNYGSDGRPLRTVVHRVNGPAPKIVLGHGHRASFVMSYTDPGVLDCRPEHPTAMIVTPPDNSVPDVVVGRGEPACGGVVDARPMQFEH